MKTETILCLKVLSYTSEAVLYGVKQEKDENAIMILLVELAREYRGEKNDV